MGAFQGLYQIIKEELEMKKESVKENDNNTDENCTKDKNKEILIEKVEKCSLIAILMALAGAVYMFVYITRPFIRNTYIMSYGKWLVLGVGVIVFIYFIISIILAFSQYNKNIKNSKHKKE